MKRFRCYDCLTWFMREGHNSKIYEIKERCNPCSLVYWGKWKSQIYLEAIALFNQQSMSLEEKTK
jgi:hypothetical protein